MVEIYIILSLILGIGIGYTLANQNKASNEEMENRFKALALDINETVSDSNTSKFLKIANDKFDNLSDKANTNLENKKLLIDKNLEEMSKRLKTIEAESIRLNKGIRNSENATDDLRDKTGKLSLLLAGSKSRGDWGERIAEDIIDFIGLKEGISYQKQTKTESSKKPDFTFKLPKGKKINMDVKFPLDNYKAYLESEDKKSKKSYKDQFFKDVNNRIKEVTTKDYIDTSSGTLDYVLLFIANESVYNFINEQDTTIIDGALKQQVLLCSPLSLYAILSLIHQSVNSFVMEQKTSEVLKQFRIFTKEWERYKGRMGKMGASLTAAQNNFEKLVVTRANTLEKPLKEIKSITDDVLAIDENIEGQQKL